MKKHILVVDDDELILFALGKTLKGDAKEVVTASTGTEAIKKISYCPYDLCLLDIHLPDMNGLELMKVIREMCPETRIIIMTASYIDFAELNGNYREAVTNGASQFIPKPFNLCDIREVVDQVLRGEEDVDKTLFLIGNGALKKSRKHPRKLCNEKVCFTMSVIDEGSISRKLLEARVVDISDNGIGLLTRCPLKESQVIGFDEKNENKTGVVTWSEMIDEDNCRVGVKFA
jgi:CheY-like chemotaxis protein